MRTNEGALDNLPLLLSVLSLILTPKRNRNPNCRYAQYSAAVDASLELRGVERHEIVSTIAEVCRG